MALVKIKGTPIEFADGVTYTVPPLSLRQVQALQDRLATYTGAIDATSVALVIDTVLAALSRNYSDMTTDSVADLIDLGNMATVMQAVMGVSGLEKKAEASGEALATA